MSTQQQHESIYRTTKSNTSVFGEDRSSSTYSLLISPDLDTPATYCGLDSSLTPAPLAVEVELVFITLVDVNVLAGVTFKANKAKK